MNKELNNILKILNNAKIHANIAVKNKSLCQARIKIAIEIYLEYYDKYKHLYYDNSINEELINLKNAIYELEFRLK
jgi:hypothetical protein